MALISRPDAWIAVIALSRPEPGPLTLTSTSLTPYLVAAAAAVSAARCAANGVLLRLPLNPTVPDEAQQSASPPGSVIVTVVLLNVALMCTTARLTLRRVFRFLAFATDPMLLVYSIDSQFRSISAATFEHVEHDDGDSSIDHRSRGRDWRRADDPRQP